MGELVAFKLPAKPKRRPAMNGGTAEILFFTGVRYVPSRERENLLKRTSQRRSRISAERRAPDRPMPRNKG